MKHLSLILSQKLIKGKKAGWRDEIYIVKAPELPEFEGYVMFVESRNLTRFVDGKMEIIHGNKWDSKNKKSFYDFELEEKIPGKRSKHYKYDNEEEVLFLYSRGKSDSFEARYNQRKELISTGPGKLVLASYMDIDEHKHPYSKKAWMILPDNTDTWAYQLNYDPLRNIGKHNLNAKGFSILEQYDIADLSIVWKNRTELEKMLIKILDIRNIEQQEYSNHHFYQNVYGETVRCQSFVEDIAITAFEGLLPEVIRQENTMFGYRERKEIEPVRKKLVELSEQMHAVCQTAINDYKRVHLTEEIQKVYELTGIKMQR